MKIVCSKTNLMEGINIVSKAVSAHSTMPILECILVYVSPDEIRLTANDMELGIETTVVGDIIENGKVALEAKRFSDMIRSMPNSEVTIETDEKYQTTISCEQARFVMAGQSGEDFPEFPQIKKESMAIISQADLRNMINQTIFSISDNEASKMMTGENLKIHNSEVSLRTLDGHRISIRNIKTMEEHEGDEDVIIPGKTMQNISRIISGDENDEVSLYFDVNHVQFEFDTTRVVSRLIDGTYYNLDEMVTDEFKTRLTLDKARLMSSIDRANVLAQGSDSNPVILDIDGSNMNLSIRTVLGSMKEDIPVKKEGENIRVGFNPKFLTDALKNISDDVVDLYLMGPRTPLTIRDENKSYIYLILPVNIAG